MNRKKSRVSNDLKKFYNSSEKYLKMISHETNPHRIKVARLYADFVAMEANGAQTILDLGCGPGLSSRLLAEKGFTVTGLDISQKFLDVSAFEKSDKLRFIQGDVCSLKFSDNLFDIVASHELIEHIPDVEKALEEMKRVVKKNGKIIILAPNLFSPLSALRAALANKKKGFYGNRLKAFGLFLRNSLLLIGKWMKKQPNFILVEPILGEFSESDEDAVYMSSFLDIYKWMRNNGFEAKPTIFPEQRFSGKLLSRHLPSLSSGIKIVAVKRDG